MGFWNIVGLVVAVVVGMVLESIQGGVTRLVTWAWWKVTGK